VAQIGDVQVKSGGRSLKQTYKIGKQIGQGNYGKVYSATLKHDSSCKVAIKVLDKKGMDSADLASLKNEVGVM
jgi:serine/threonine protein kinase